MTYKKQKEIIDRLRLILMQEFEFNGVKIILNFCERAKHSKHWLIRTHYHPWFEFNYVSKGSAYTTIDGKEFFVESGQSYMISPGVKHSHRNNGTGDDGICIRFSLETEGCNTRYRSIMDALFTPQPYPFDSNIEKLNLYGNVYTIEAEFLSFLMHFSDIFDNDERKTRNTPSNIIANQVFLYLNEYYNTKIRAEDLANALNMSYRNLSRKFKEETCMTISDKLTEIRIEKAKSLLNTTNMPLYDIAVAVGYENEFYFSKKFKQYEKKSPIHYKKISATTNIYT